MRSTLVLYRSLAVERTLGQLVAQSSFANVGVVGNRCSGSPPRAFLKQLIGEPSLRSLEVGGLDITRPAEILAELCCPVALFSSVELHFKPSQILTQALFDSKELEYVAVNWSSTLLFLGLHIHQNKTSTGTAASRSMGLFTAFRSWRRRR